MNIKINPLTKVLLKKIVKNPTLVELSVKCRNITVFLNERPCNQDKFQTLSLRLSLYDLGAN